MVVRRREVGEEGRVVRRVRPSRGFAFRWREERGRESPNLPGLEDVGGGFVLRWRNCLCVCVVVVTSVVFW